MIKQNEMFIATTGEYSDYGVQELFKAKADITEEMIKGRPEGRSLQGWLVEMDLAQVIDCGEVWEECTGHGDVEVIDKI